MSDRHTDRWLGAYALGSLGPEEAEQAAAHLARCVQCRTDLRAYEEILGYLGLAVPDLEPPSSLREQTLTQARAPTKAPSPRRPSFEGDLARLHPALTLASWVAVVVLALVALTLWQRVLVCVNDFDTTLAPI